MRRVAPAFRHWVDKGQELRSDIRYEARRPELLDPAETAAATAAEVGHPARLARDAQRAEYSQAEAFADDQPATYLTYRAAQSAAFAFPGASSREQNR